MAKEFKRAWKKATGQAYSHAPMSLTPEQLRSLPTILIQCKAFSLDDDPSIEDYDTLIGYAGSLDPSSPKDLLVAIPATSYMDYSTISKRYMSRLYFTESVGGVLGSNTMQGHNVLFDWQNGRIGFAESSCAFDKKEAPGVSEDSGFATDCQVGDPILSKACIETVDRRMCKLNPTSIALLGKESWTAVVESPGNDAGVSCLEASMSVGMKRNEFEDPIVTCAGHGVCEEERPCQLTCAQTLKAAEIRPLLRNGIHVTCSDSGWSACDYGCGQTKIDSVMFTDGFCREMSRSKRPCHIGACARSDPCRVPFIVHVVFAFRGGSIEHWSRDADEILANALVNAVGIYVAEQMIKVGDVHVVTAFPWYQDQDEYDAQDFGGKLKRDYGDEYNGTKLGVKVVIEISMFNPLADTRGKTAPLDDLSDGTDDPLTRTLRNMTDRWRGGNRRVVCKHDELYSLAKLALKTTSIIRRENFTLSLMDEVKFAGDQADMLAFGPVNSAAYEASENRILALWTYRTGIGDEEVNFFGPQKPFAMKVVTILQNLVVLCLLFFAVMVLWSCIVTVSESVASRSRHARSLHRNKFAVTPFRGSEPYSLVTWIEDPNNPNDVEDSIIIGTSGEMELIARNPIYKLTMPKKRVRRVSSIDSSER